MNVWTRFKKGLDYSAPRRTRPSSIPDLKRRGCSRVALFRCKAVDGEGGYAAAPGSPDERWKAATRG